MQVIAVDCDFATRPSVTRNYVNFSLWQWAQWRHNISGDPASFGSQRIVPQSEREEVNLDGRSESAHGRPDCTNRLADDNE
jgi:hypothetical protein